MYVAQDLQTGKEYALKRLVGADKQACNAIINEINLHKQLSGHRNIVAFIGASFIDNTTGPEQHAEYLLLTELCKGLCETNAIFIHFFIRVCLKFYRWLIDRLFE